MDFASVSDLDNLDRDALLAIYRAQQQKLTSLISARDEELRRLEAEIESQRQTLSERLCCKFSPGRMVPEAFLSQRIRRSGGRACQL